MAECPDALALLAAARLSVIDELLPLLGPEHRVNALMVAKALSIAARELETGPIALRLPHGDTATDAQIRERLRAGESADEAGMLRAALMEMTRARLRVSNPKLLATLDSLYGHEEP